jgi:hypothetical protein
LAASAPPLGAADSFAVLAGSTVTNTGPSIIVGNVGVDPGSAITGFPPGTVTGGTIQISNGVTTAAQANQHDAYLDLAGQPCNTNLTGQDLGGLTLFPGVYCFASSAQLTGNLHLDANGDANPVWVFQIGTALTTGSNSAVIFDNVGQANNVFWQAGTSVTVGIGTAFKGNILALASITLNTGATLSGRALAFNGAVTLDSNIITSQPLPGSPTLGKSFSPAIINMGGTSTLTITLSNPNASVATITAPLIDTLPVGVVIATPSITQNTCGGILTVLADGTTVTLNGGTIPGGAPGTCTVTVAVTAANAGNYINTLLGGALQTDHGNNSDPAIATLTVNPAIGPSAMPPTVSKSFLPFIINAGGTSTLTIILSNASTGSPDIITTLTDNLPIGVVIANPANANTTCAGGSLSATAGTGTILLTGGTIPTSGGSVPGTCTVTVNVTAVNAGNYINTIAAGGLITQQGNNADPAIATLTVPQPPITPSLGKAFNPTSITPGMGGSGSGVSVLTITLINPNSTVATLTSPLIDSLPGGMHVANPANATTTCGGGKAVTAAVGGTTVTLPTGSSIPANGSCTVTVNVVAPCAGSYFNNLLVGALQTNKGSNAALAVGILTVTPPLAPFALKLSQAFSPATINAGGVSTLTITLNNPNNKVSTLTAPLIDTLPSGMAIANPANATTTCGGGTSVTAAAGGTMVTLPIRSSIPAQASCTVRVNVTAQYKNIGNYLNNLPGGALKTDKGSNAASALATLTVLSPVTDEVTLQVPMPAVVATRTISSQTVATTLSQAFSPATINAGGVSILTITLSNPNSSGATLTAPLTNALPSGIAIVIPANATTTCGGGTAVIAAAGGTLVTLTGGLIPANGSCMITMPVTAVNAGNYINTLAVGDLQTDKGSNTSPAIAALTVRM